MIKNVSAQYRYWRVLNCTTCICAQLTVSKKKEEVVRIHPVVTAELFIERRRTIDWVSVSSSPRTHTPAACPPLGSACSCAGTWAGAPAEGFPRPAGWPPCSGWSCCSSTEPEHHSEPPPRLAPGFLPPARPHWERSPTGWPEPRRKRGARWWEAECRRVDGHADLPRLNGS